MKHNTCSKKYRCPHFEKQRHKLVISVSSSLISSNQQISSEKQFCQLSEVQSHRQTTQQVQSMRQKKKPASVRERKDKDNRGFYSSWEAEGGRGGGGAERTGRSKTLHFSLEMFVKNTRDPDRRPVQSDRLIKNTDYEPTWNMKTRDNVRENDFP